MGRSWAGHQQNSLQHQGRVGQEDQGCIQEIFQGGGPEVMLQVLRPYWGCGRRHKEASLNIMCRGQPHNVCSQLWHFWNILCMYFSWSYEYFCTHQIFSLITIRIFCIRIGHKEQYPFRTVLLSCSHIGKGSGSDL